MLKDMHLLNLALKLGYRVRYETVTVNHSWENYCSRILLFAAAEQEDLTTKTFANFAVYRKKSSSEKN